MDTKLCAAKCHADCKADTVVKKGCSAALKTDCYACKTGTIPNIAVAGNANKYSVYEAAG